MMDVVAPYDKRMLPPVFHNWYLPLEVSVVMDASKILPTIAWTNGELRIRREPCHRRSGTPYLTHAFLTTRASCVLARGTRDAVGRTLTLPSPRGRGIVGPALRAWRRTQPLSGTG